MTVDSFSLASKLIDASDDEIGNGIEVRKGQRFLLEKEGENKA